MTTEEAQAILDSIPDVVSHGGGSLDRRWLRQGNKIMTLIPDRIYCKGGDVYHLNVTWVGQAPEHCDIMPDRKITDAFVDGRVRGHGWATMHPDTHAAIGCGFGTGNGQLYKKVGEHFYKVT